MHEVPPFLFAAVRFLVAGFVLYGWMIARGERSPNGRQWMSIFLLALLIFVFDYGLLFWAEQRVPSGVAAVMMAMIPAFMALSEIILLRTQRLTVRLALALLIGIGGVAVLMNHSLNLGGAPVDRAGAASTDRWIDQLVSRVCSFAQAAASIVQSHEFGGANARRRIHAGSHDRRTG